VRPSSSPRPLPPGWTARSKRQSTAALPTLTHRDRPGLGSSSTPAAGCPQTPRAVRPSGGGNSRHPMDLGLDVPFASATSVLGGARTGRPQPRDARPSLGGDDPLDPAQAPGDGPSARRCAAGFYRPRDPRRSPFYQLIAEHFPAFKAVYAQR
jgi:hypothetical protein